MTLAEAKKLGYTIERYPALPGERRDGRRWLWRLHRPDGLTLNAGYASRRKLLRWLAAELEAGADRR